jgi:hypothetical protein
MRSVPGTRRIFGRISGGSGAATNGSGFTVSKTSTGVYVIRFDKPFRTPPVVTATPNSQGYMTVQTNEITASSVTVRFVNTATTAADSDFGFIAEGRD